MANTDGSYKLRWNSFFLVYLLLGFTALCAAAILLAQISTSENGLNVLHLAVFLPGLALIALGFIADEVSYRRGDYTMPVQQSTVTA